MLQDVEDRTKAICSGKENHKSLITLDLSDFPSRYRDVCPIGCGSKSLIFSAIDQRSLHRLAIKQLTVKQEEKTKFLRQILREIRVLHRLEHNNIIKIYHVLVSTVGATSCDKQAPSTLVASDVPNIDCLYIGMELMDTDLRNVLSKSSLDAEYVRLFMYQILRGAKYMHSANVMHRDLNPSNILINMDTLMLKIADFGISRMYDCDYDHTYHLSMPLTTKYYHAPELLLHPHHYTTEIDIWSIACIFIEMLKGSPAFPGEHALELMELIMNTVPVTKENWQSVVQAGCQNIECCAPAIAYAVQENDGCPIMPLEKILPAVASSAINLLKQLLLFDPVLRIDAEDALNHPYFVLYTNPQDEPSCYRRFHIEDELDDYSVGDLEIMLQNESYSVTSSFSRSTDTTVSQPAQTLGFEDINLLRAHSGAGLVTNGSYRHLLSLAENNQSEVLSESEVRTIACDLDYGVQIHECSFNKDRMSVDFRPISSNSGCFDPYKWDHTARDATPSDFVKKDLLSSVNTARPNKSHEPAQSGVSRSDTGYHSSYCSSSATNRISNVPSLSHWSLSSTDISSDHEQRLSSPINTLTDPDSSANSPTLQEDPQSETVLFRRHNESLVQQSSRRHHHHSHHHHHHHHSHHHHHHHHHHSKHKTRPNQSSSLTGSLHLKPGSGDSSYEHTDSTSSSNIKQKRCSGKRSKSCKDKRVDESCTTEENSDVFVILPKNVIVTGPDNVVISQISDIGNCHIKEKVRCPVEELNPLVLEHANNGDTIVEKYGQEESVHEFSGTTSNTDTKKNPASAFTKYVSRYEKEDVANNEETAPKVSAEFTSKTLESMWKADIGYLPAGTEIEEPERPRTWSEGCHMRLPRRQGVASFLCAKSENFKSGGVLTCSLVQKIRSQVGQLFSEGCCLTYPDTSVPSVSKHANTSYLTRMRHFSDDRRFVCSPSAFSATQEQIVGGTPSTSGPPATCASLDSQPGTRMPRTRVECPF